MLYILSLRRFFRPSHHPSVKYCQMTWSIPWDTMRYLKHWSLIMHVSKDSKSEPSPCRTEEQTLHDSLPLRIPSGTRSSTLFMASSKLVRWCQMRGSKGKDQLEYLNGFTFACSCWPRQTWAASIFDVAQHLADAKKKRTCVGADHLSLFWGDD